MDDKYVVDAPFEFQISDVFSVPFVGTVVVGPVDLSQESINLL
jgi:translation elongation factor EF-Tu-like GTPase